MPFNEDGSRKKGPLYKKSGFKMKGNPMQRNFGVGSPMRDEKEELKGVLPEVKVSGGKKTVPGSLVQHEKAQGTSIAGSSIEHGELRKKSKKGTISPSEKGRLKDLNVATEKAYWAMKEKSRKKRVR